LEEIKGWLWKKREHGGVIFLDVRNASGITQCVVKRSEASEELWEKAKRVTQESSLIIMGESVKEPRAPGGREIRVKEIEIVHIAESPYPLGKKEHSQAFLMEKRHLAVRGLKYQAVFKVRNVVLKACREYFEENGWYEISPPIIIGTACEGGATLLEVNYFGHKKFLSQSAQLYLEAMIYSLEKVWSLTPSFRAEKSRTRRHLVEFWHLEAEAAWFKLEDIMRVEEELVSHVCSRVAEECSEQLLFLGRKPEDLKRIKPPFKKMTYEEAIQYLKNKGVDIKWGEDFGADEEKILTIDVKEPFFIHSYPIEVKAFYVKEDPNRKGIGLTADLLAPEGYGEITTGGEREEDINKLVERIKKEGFSPEDYSWYLDLRRYGSVPHGGFGLGIERFLMWICKLQHIRDALPFPRMARVLTMII